MLSSPNRLQYVNVMVTLLIMTQSGSSSESSCSPAIICFTHSLTGRPHHPHGWPVGTPTESNSRRACTMEEKWLQIHKWGVGGPWWETLSTKISVSLAKLTHGRDHVSKGSMMAAISKHWFIKGFSSYSQKFCQVCMTWQTIWPSTDGFYWINTKWREEILLGHLNKTQLP